MKPSYEYLARVVRVIDGDTIVVDIDLGCHIWLKNEHIRFQGINAPEIRGTEKERGDLAKNAVMLWLKPGAEVLLRTELDKRGKYGRFVATVIEEGGLVLNDWLVEQGLAKRVDY